MPHLFKLVTGVAACLQWSDTLIPRRAYVSGVSPNTVLAPDFAFVRAERVPHPAEEGFPRLAPDLVAEVLSPSQTLPQLRRKAETWLTYGVDVVWILAPEKRSIEVWRVDEPPLTLRADETVVGDGTLAEFAVTVADVFAP